MLFILTGISGNWCNYHKEIHIHTSLHYYIMAKVFRLTYGGWQLVDNLHVHVATVTDHNLHVCILCITLALYTVVCTCNAWVLVCIIVCVYMSIWVSECVCVCVCVSECVCVCVCMCETVSAHSCIVVACIGCGFLVVRWQRQLSQDTHHVHHWTVTKSGYWT